VARPPERRLVSLCRDYAVLLVSLLRRQGIPARLRVGFGGYFHGSGLANWDHRIAEYWNARSNRWVLVDPMIDDVMRAKRGFTIDTLDMTGDTPFLVASDVWRRCRAGQAIPDEFGDSLTDIGWGPIRYALLGDIDALTINIDSCFDERRALYQATPYGQAVRRRLADALPA